MSDLFDFDLQDQPNSLFGNNVETQIRYTGGYDWQQNRSGSRAAQFASSDAALSHRRDGEESGGLLSLEDTLLFLPRGLEGAVQGVYGLIDMAAFDALPDYTDEDRVFGQSKTLIGGFAEGLTQFLIPFAGIGMAGRLGKLGKVGQWLAKDTMVSEAARGAIVDFAAFQGSDGRLSDLVKGTPFENAVTEYLATDMDDSEFEGRLKNLAEGGILSSLIDPLFRGSKMIKEYKKYKNGGMSDFESAVGAVGIFDERFDEFIDQQSLRVAKERKTALGRALPDDAMPKPYEPGRDPELDGLRLEAGAGDVEPEVWRGTVNELLQDTKIADGLTGQAREAALEFVGMVGARNFDDVSVQIGGEATERGVTASYSYLRKTVSIFSEAFRQGSVGENTMHELWHALEQRLSGKQRRKVVSEFLSERQAYLSKNEAAAQRLDRLRSAANEGEVANAVRDIIAHDEYQYISPAEWWATKGTLSTQQRQAQLATIKDKGVRGLLAQTNLIWADFTSSLRKAFGIETADSMVQQFLSGRVRAGTNSVNNLRGLSRMGVETVYAPRNLRALADEEVKSISGAVEDGIKKGLTGIELAASIPYPQLLNGYNAIANVVEKAPKFGKGADAAPIIVEEIPGANIIRALVQFSSPHASEQIKELAEDYLKTIGVVPTPDAVRKLTNIIDESKRKIEQMVSTKKDTSAVSTADTGLVETSRGAVDVAAEKKARSEQKIGNVGKSKEDMKEDIKEMDRSLKEAGLSDFETIKWMAHSRLSITGQMSVADAFLEKKLTDGKLDIKELDEIKAFLVNDVAEQKAKTKNKTAAQQETIRTQTSKRTTSIPITASDVKEILDALGTATPEKALRGGGRSFYTTVQSKTLTTLRESRDKAVAKAQEALKTYGQDSPEYAKAQKEARAKTRDYENTKERADLEGVVETLAEEAPAKKPAKKAEPEAAAAAPTEAPAKVVDVKAELARIDAEAQPKIEEAAAKARAAADEAARLAEEINSMPTKGPQRADARKRITQLKTEARTAEELVASLRTQVALVKEQIEAQAPKAEAAPEAAAVPETEPQFDVAEANEGPITTSVFPSTAEPVVPEGKKPKPRKERATAVKKRRAVEREVANVIEDKAEGVPSESPVAAKVEEIVAAKPELQEALSSPDAGTRAEAIDEIADAVEAAPPEKPAAAPAAPTVDLTSVKQKLDEIEAKYKKEQGKYEKAKDQEAESKAMNAMDKLAKERDALKQQIADAEAYETKRGQLRDANRKFHSATSESEKSAAQAESDRLSKELVENVSTPGGRLKTTSTLNDLLDDAFASNPVFADDVAPAAPAAPNPLDFKLPRDLAGAKPKYFNEVLEFASDYDKVAYILAGDKPSKSEFKYRAALESAGLSVDEAIAHGQVIKKALKKEGATAVEVPLAKAPEPEAAPAAAATPAAEAPPAGGITPPAEVPPPAATPPSEAGVGGERRRRKPEEIGAEIEAGKVPSAEDAEDLIWWMENNPAKIGPEGVNPRNLNPEELVDAWLMEKAASLNFSKLLIDGHEASFLRVVERYVVGKRLERRKLRGDSSDLGTLRMKDLEDMGLKFLSEESGISVWDLATQLRTDARTVREIAHRTYRGRLVMLASNAEIVRDIGVLKPELESGSITDEVLIATMMKIVAHGEIAGAVRDVSSEAGRLLRSLRAEIKNSIGDLQLSYEAGTTRATAPTAAPAPAAAATPAAAPAPVPAGTPAPSSGASTDPTATVAPATPPTGTPPATTPAPAPVSPRTRIKQFDDATARQLNALRNIYGEERLKEILQKLGGRDKVIITLNKYLSLLENQVRKGESIGPIVSKIGNAIRRVGFFDFHNELWINALVSSSTTWVGVQSIANSLTAVLRPMEQILGGAAVSMRSNDGARAMAVGLRTYEGMVRGFTESLTMAKKSFSEKKPIGIGSTYESAPQNVWSSQNIPGIRKLAAKGGKRTEEEVNRVVARADSIMGTISLPQRLIMTGDEFFKQLNYRGQLYARLYENFDKQGIVGSARESRIKEAMDKAILDGEFLTNERLLKDGQTAAVRELGPATTMKEINEYAKKYRDDRWAELSAVAGTTDSSYDVRTMMDASLYGAKEATMQADPRFPWQKSLNQLVSRHPSTRLFLPFVSTPINALIYAGDRFAPWHLAQWSKAKMGGKLASRLETAGAPAFVVDGLRNNENRFMRDLNSKDPIASGDAVGRAIMGTAFMGAVVALTVNGMITGYGPKNKDERATWVQAGFQPYSIRIGDKWFSFGRLDPFTTLLGTTADLMLAAKYANMDEQNFSLVEEGLASVYMSLVNNLTNKGYLQGIKTAVELLSTQDSSAFQKWAVKQAGSLVPFSSMLRTLTDYTDDYKRVNDQSFDDALVSAIYSQIPGLSNENLPARDLMGRPMTRTERLGPDLFSPINVVPVQDDEIRNELITLGRAFRGAHYSRDGLDLRRIALEDGRNAFDYLQESTGQIKLRGKTMEEAVRALIRSDRYKAMSPYSSEYMDSPRVLAIRAEMAKYSARAWVDMQRKYPKLRNAVNQIKQSKGLAKIGQTPTKLAIYE